MAKITFLAYEGCFFSGISSLIDGFWIANAWHGAMCDTACGSLFETRIVTVDGKPVRAAGNVQILPDGAMAGEEPADVIVIPASPTVPQCSVPGMEAILEWLKRQHQRNITLAATCTGAFVLAEAGLLDGRTATTNWQFARQFKRRYPKVRLRMDRILTEEENMVCTGAASAVLNLGLHLIRRYGSEELASVCAKALLVDPHRDRQTPYVIFSARQDHGDPEILQAQQYMHDQFGNAIAIDDLARQVGISPRHFKRRFRKATGESPLGYLQNLRIEAAKKKLETTRENVNEITYRIGYEDSSTFRRLFKKHTGISPREYRDKFCGRQS
ncbi:MAG: GlxA family transcriptional regulator [Desulfobacteraceae bacterium]|nr:GlxA family transcriptional regulator [Desulfobacteraceae bacterium]